MILSTTTAPPIYINRWSGLFIHAGVIKGQCHEGSLRISGVQNSTSFTVIAPIVSWVAIFRRSPKKSFSSNRQLLQTIFLFAPSGSILVKTGNI